MRNIENFSDLIEARTRDLQTCSILPQPNAVRQPQFDELEKFLKEVAVAYFMYYPSNCLEVENHEKPHLNDLLEVMKKTMKNLISTTS
jgi:hypothetical protein